MTTADQKVLARVGHMLEAIRHANSDIEGMSLEQFLADGKSQRAVNDSIIVIGEAASRIMQVAAQLQHEHVTFWEQLQNANDMRNMLAHEYFRVDAAIVWATVKNNLPELRDHLTSYLAGQSGS